MIPVTVLDQADLIAQMTDRPVQDVLDEIVVDEAQLADIVTDIADECGLDADEAAAVAEVVADSAVEAE